MAMSKEEDLKYYSLEEMKKAEESGWIEKQEGFIGLNENGGLFIPQEDAFAYAFERCTNGTDKQIAEFKEMLVEWFFSGDWIKRDIKTEL